MGTQSKSFKLVPGSVLKSDTRVSSEEISIDQCLLTPSCVIRKHPLNNGDGAVDDGNIMDSPNNPMKILASLSSHAAPVPIVDDDDGGKFNQSILMPSIQQSLSSSSLPRHVGSSWKTNKRFKVEYTQKSTKSYGTNSDDCEEISKVRVDAEDAKTFVNFLQSVIRVKD